MSLNSLSARKLRSAHNSPRHFPTANRPGFGAVAAVAGANQDSPRTAAIVRDAISTAAAEAESPSSMATTPDSHASPTNDNDNGTARKLNFGDDDSADANSAEAKVGDTTTTTTQKQKESGSGGGGGGGSDNTNPISKTMTNGSPTSYQQKLEARVTRPPSRYRPKSSSGGSQLRVRPGTGGQHIVDRNAHHITVGGGRNRNASGNANGDGNGNASGGGGDDGDKGQVSFLSSMSLRIKSLEAANRSLRIALVDKEKQCLR